MKPEKTRISIVNYTNTLPFKWALKRSSLMEGIDLQEDIPSICAQKLKFGQVDLALVPVALLPELENYQIVSDYCIGANGKVDTVKLYSKVPLKDVHSVSLDYQSKTSNALTRVLFKNFWKQDMKYLQAMPGFENSFNANQAIVVIGDRCFKLNGKFSFEYDLAEEWKKLTGLPFVFAVWVCTASLTSAFVKEFNDCLRYGIDHIALAVEERIEESPLNKQDTIDYLSQRIDYHLDDQKRQALDLFLNHFNHLE